MCTSSNISKVKVDDILGDIKCVKTYINYIILIRKDNLPKHIYQLRVIFYRIYRSGTTVDTPK